MRALLPLLPCVLLLACNETPEGLAVSISPALPGTADVLTVVLDQPAVDPDANDTVTYSYSWTVDGEFADVDGDSVAPSLTKKGQLWKVVATPSDGSSFGSTASAEVTIANSLPVATVVIEPTSPGTGDSFAATVGHSDADLDRVTLNYAWTVDGVASTIKKDRVPSEDTAKGQVWQVTVTPSDPDGAGEPVSAQVTIGNEAPAITGAHIEPAILTRLVVASCVGEGWSDPNNDAEGYQVEWAVDGTEVSTDATLNLAPYVRGSKVKCTLTPFDGEASGAPVDSDESFIRNAAPTLASVTIGPVDPKAGTVISATVGELLDADGDEVTLAYSWLVNGAERSTLATLAGNRFARGQTIQLSVTPQDGPSDGLAVLSNTLNAANSLPVVTSLEIGPEDPATDALVTAAVTTSDADGDRVTVSYEWYVDGGIVTETSDTLDGAADFDKFEDIYVVVTATDTEAGLPVTSDTLTAVNTPPPSPKLAMSDDEPGAEDDVVCEIDVQEPDLDRDTISYTFAWTVDGVAFTGATTTTHTGDTIEGSDRGVDEEWICQVTPNDGDDDGIPTKRTLGITPPTDIIASGTLVSTTLQKGSMAGTTYNDDCPSGEVVVGLAADLTKSGGYFSGLAARCAPMELSCVSTTCTVSTGTVSTTTKRGGTGTLKVDQDCSSGEAVIGFRGRKGWYLDQLTLRCAPVEVTHDGSVWSISLGTSSDNADLGGTGGSVFSQTDCSSGTFATRAVISAATGQVDGFGLGCKDPDIVE